MSSNFDVTMDTERFTKSLRRFKRRTDGDFAKLLRKIALMVLTGVVLKTPVDTGLARANWQLRVGSVNNDILDGSEDSISSGLANMQTLSNFGIGEVIFIFNNVEYTIYLEFGTDTMEPRAMVRDTLSEVATSLDG